MTVICSKTDKVCFDCVLPCKPVTIQAIEVPKERNESAFSGIFSTIEKATEIVSIETNMQDEAKINITIQL